VLLDPVQLIGISIVISEQWMRDNKRELLLFLDFLDLLPQRCTIIKPLTILRVWKGVPYSFRWVNKLEKDRNNGTNTMVLLWQWHNFFVTQPTPATFYQNFGAIVPEQVVLFCCVYCRVKDTL
jgi:hypothetical protein